MTEPIKEATKFENLSSEMDRTPGLITEMFQIVNNIENKLGESRDVCEPDCKESPEPTALIERTTLRARRINDDIIGLNTRLDCIQNLF